MLITAKLVDITKNVLKMKKKKKSMNWRKFPGNLLSSLSAPTCELCSSEILQE